MKKSSFPKRIVTVLFAVLICCGMILSSCSSSDSEKESTKNKKSKKTETAEVIEEETEPEEESSYETTTETTTTEPETSETEEPSDPGRLNLAGTYEGYALQTKAEFYPEKGTVNNYPILKNDGSFRMVLNADGTGTWEDAQAGTSEITEWTADGETVLVTISDRSIPGTIRNGLVCMNDTDMYRYYAQDGSDPSFFGAITENEAVLVTGIDYYFGLGTEGFDLDKAVSCFKTAMAAGVPDAYYWMGRYYKNSTLCIDHYITAMDYFDQAIALGSAYGLAGKGTMYESGDGVDKDYAKAYELYKQAADAGCMLGFPYIGNLFRTGLVPGQSGADGSKAIEYCEKGLSSRNWYDQVYSYLAIGVVYETGAGDVSKDATKAIEYYLKASDMGFGRAMYRIGNMYDDGNGVAQDQATGNYWFEKAVAHGDIYSMVNLGYNYQYALGVAQNSEEAFRLYLLAAECGNSVGAYDVGILYYRGTGTTQDYSAAKMWFEAAAREDYAAAYQYLGDIYKDGLGVTENKQTAFNYYVEGAMLGNPCSAGRAGDCYLYGRGTSVDYYKALDFYALGMKKANVSDSNDKTHYDYCQKQIAYMVTQGYIRQDQANAAVG